MASVAYLLEDAQNIYEEIRRRCDEAEEHKLGEYRAAVCIQRWFRGYITRKHILWLHAQATIIQRHWRGYLGRKYYLEVLKERVHEMCKQYYDLMATRIQKLWRGYWIRETVFCYREFKDWIYDILEKNDIMEFELQYFYHKEMVDKITSLEKDAARKILHATFKNHHLIRTFAIPGIYSLRNTTKLSEIEEHLLCLKYIEFMKTMHREYQELKEIDKNKPPLELIFKGTLRKCEKFWRERNLPHRSSIQGEGENVDSADVLKLNKREDFHLPRWNFPLVRYDDKDALNTIPEKSAKNLLCKSSSTSKVSKKRFVTHFPRIDTFDKLLECKYIHNDEVSPKMEFYTKSPTCNCHKKVWRVKKKCLFPDTVSPEDYY